MYDADEELRTTFLEEAEETLSKLEQLIMALEKGANPTSELTELFRLMHNFKGAAAAAGLSDLAKMIHSAESLLSRLKLGQIQVSPERVSLLLTANDYFGECVSQIKEGHSDGALRAELVDQLEAA